MPVVEYNPVWKDASTPNALVRVGDLVRREEVSSRLGVSRTQVYSWTSHRDETGFPFPILGKDSSRQNVNTAVYHMPDIHMWYAYWNVHKNQGGGPTVSYSRTNEASAKRMRASRARASGACKTSSCSRKGRPALNDLCVECYYTQVIKEYQ